MTAVDDRESVARRAELDGAALELDRESRAGVKSVELDERVERRRNALERRPQRIGELGENAVDLANLVRLELTNPVACFHRRRRLDEQRAAGGRCVVDDAADNGARLAPYRNDKAAIADRHRHVRHLMMRVQLGRRFAREASPARPASRAARAGRAAAKATRHRAHSHRRQSRRRFFSRRPARRAAHRARAPSSASHSTGTRSPRNESAVSRELRRRWDNARISVADSEAPSTRKRARAGRTSGIGCGDHPASSSIRARATATRECSRSSQSVSVRGANERNRSAPSVDAARAASSSSAAGYSMTRSACGFTADVPGSTVQKKPELASVVASSGFETACV